MKLTKKFLALLAIAAMTAACSSSTKEEPKPEEPKPPITGETGYPADSNPTKFDNFFKRTMVIDHTGTGCGYCPRVMLILNEIEKSADKDKTVIIAAHTYNSSDPMYNSFAIKYKNACGVNSYPTVNLDLRRTSDAEFNSGTAADVFKKCDALEKKYPAKVAIAAKVTFDGTNFIVNTGVKIGVAGKYNIGVTVLENGIKANQSNYGFTGSFNTHNHAVRGGMPTSSVTGSPLMEGEIAANQVINKDFTVPVPDKTKAENASIVVYVATADSDGGKMYINNAIVCKPGESVPFKYKE